jgi:chromosomal replication initiation ATPase DnaA
VLSVLAQEGSVMRHDLISACLSGEPTSIDDIMHTVCRVTNTPRTLIMSRSKTRPVVMPRQIVCYFAVVYKNRLKISYKDIADKLKLRTHGTVIHSHRLIHNLRSQPVFINGRKLSSIIDQLYLSFSDKNPNNIGNCKNI